VDGGGLLQIIHQRIDFNTAVALAVVGLDRERLLPDIHIRIIISDGYAYKDISSVLQNEAQETGI